MKMKFKERMLWKILRPLTKFNSEELKAVSDSLFQQFKPDSVEYALGEVAARFGGLQALAELVFDENLEEKLDNDIV